MSPAQNDTVSGEIATPLNNCLGMALLFGMHVAEFRFSSLSLNGCRDEPGSRKLVLSGSRSSPLPLIHFDQILPET